MSYRDYIKDMDLYELNNLLEVINDRKLKIESEDKKIVWYIIERSGMGCGYYKQEDYAIAVKALATEAIRRYNAEIDAGGSLDMRYLGLEIRGVRTPMSEYIKYDFDNE